MSLREKLNEELKASMKARDKERTGALRLLLSEVKKEVDHEKLPDDKIISIVSHMIKEREDSIKQYKDAGRPELAVKEEGEIKVISEFLPPSSRMTRSPRSSTRRSAQPERPE